MKEHIKDFLLVAIPILLIAVLFMQLVAVKGVARVNNDLKNDIEYLESRIELYQNNEEWFEDLIEFSDYTWQQKIEVEVLKERIYWLNKYRESTEYNKEYADKMFDDIEAYLLIMIDYVEKHSNLTHFNDYFYSYHRELYDLIGVYSENHG